MTVDGKLLEILCCPVTQTPLTRLSASRLDRLNSAISAGTAKYVSGETVEENLDEALITEDSKVMYPVQDGIPMLLEEYGIGSTQFNDF